MSLVSREKAMTWRGDALRVFVPPESPLPVVVWSVEAEDEELRASLGDWLRSEDPLGVRRVLALESASAVTVAVTDSLDANLTWAVTGP